jgi:hypothetical protein
MSTTEPESTEQTQVTPAPEPETEPAHGDTTPDEE